MTSDSIVIGKRIPIGAAITSIATVIASFFPDQSIAIMAAAVPITAVVQIYVVNKIGVTTKES